MLPTLKDYVKASMKNLSPVSPHGTWYKFCVFVNAYILQGLGEWVSIPCTYAGGAKDISDLALVDRLSSGKVDLTFGSSLDIFGGKGVKFTDLVKADKEAKKQSV